MKSNLKMSKYSESSKKYNIDHIVKNVVELMSVEKSRRNYSQIIENIIKMEESSDFTLFNLSLIMNNTGIGFADLCKEIAPYLSGIQKEKLKKVFSDNYVVID